MDLILPIILIASSFGIFFGYVDPNYKGNANQTSSNYEQDGVVFLQAELAKYNDILQSSTKIVSQRDALVIKRNNITTSDESKLQRLLPSNIDNIRLIIEISGIAQNRGLGARNISVGDMTQTSTDTIGANNGAYGTLSLNFTVTASYSDFLNLLRDLENNLRLLDVTNITFRSTESGLYDYTVTLNTYWLK